MTPELLERMLANQSQELSIRAAELQLEQQREQNAFAFGKEALAVQATDREQQRKHLAYVRQCSYIFVGIIVFVIAGVIIFALFQGKDAFASELMKAIFFLLSGGAGGYGAAKATQKTASPSSTKRTTV